MGDSYGIDGISLSGSHGLYSFQVKPGRASDLVKIHSGEGPKGLYQNIKFLLFQLEKIFLEIRKVQVKFQCPSPWPRGQFLRVCFALPNGQRLSADFEMLYP